MSSKDAILSAARALLWERGFDAMSPRAVLEASGAGQGSLYHHFKGKKDLAIRVLDDVEEELSDAAEHILTHPELPALERIKAWLTMPRKATKGCRMGRLAQEKPVTQDKELRAPVARYFKRTRAALVDAIGEAHAEGTLAKTLDPGATASLLLATVQGGYVLSRAACSSKGLDEATRAAVALLEAAAP